MVEIKQRRNGNMLMHDVFVSGKKIGHFFNTGVSYWARKIDNSVKPKQSEQRFLTREAAIDWLTHHARASSQSRGWLVLRHRERRGGGLK